MDLPRVLPARVSDSEDYNRRVPVHVVWELTLACNLKCQHCGSRAGKARPDELTTAECLDVVDRLARMGTREITLIGGEAYLRPDWTEIVRAIYDRGIYCAMQTGARNLTDRCLAAGVSAGLQGLGVSIDGPPELHDRLRGVQGSYDMAVSALVRAREAGLRTSVNTTIGAATLPHLADVMDRILAAGATRWQIQLTVAMGNAVDHDDILLQPHQLAELMPLLARLYHKGMDRGLLLVAGNNVGYYGPYEQLWRSHFEEGVHWGGCQAGQTGIGLESDGTIKGCPSLATAGYSGGNVRDVPIEELWETSERLRFNRRRSVEDLWGPCRTCYYAEVCDGGCTWTADSLFGRGGNNPYCHYRVLELEKQGLRERVVKKRGALMKAFATGEFTLVTEPIPGRALDPTYQSPRPPPDRAPVLEGERPPPLSICRACDAFIYPEETTCPHCRADVAGAAATHAEDRRRRLALVVEVEALVERARAERARRAAASSAVPG